MAPAPVGPQFEMDSEAVPSPKKHHGMKPIYFPFGEMEVGRSFTTHRVIWTVRTAARRFKKESGEMDREYTVRALPDGRVRCWRLK